jgi:hypothetical protein
VSNLDPRPSAHAAIAGAGGVFGRVVATRTLAVEELRVLTTWNGVPVRHGGFGSDLALDPRDSDVFYLLADRGPNFDTPRDDEKGFAVPRFTPRIGRFRRQGERLHLEATIDLRTADGRRLSGLPHAAGPDSTGETAVDLDGRVLDFDPEGIDAEGLALLPDGSLWVSDEYGPYLLHFGGDGRMIERVSPWSRPRGLPAVFGTRRPNRGMEGLTLLPDGRTLVGIMQSSLDNPSKEVRARSTVTRLVAFDTETGQTRQYLYLQEAPAMSNSAICALSATELLVIEHDALLPGARGEPSWHKRIYHIDLAEASDVSDPDDHPQGVRLGGWTLEQCTADELRGAGVRPVRKSLVADLLPLGYPHDKPEGIAMLDPYTIAVVNDDDFGIVGDGEGGIRTKILPLTGETDANRLWIITLERPMVGGA